jgi:hypothetical protein
MQKHVKSQSGGVVPWTRKSIRRNVSPRPRAGEKFKAENERNILPTPGDCGGRVCPQAKKIP